MRRQIRPGPLALLVVLASLVAGAAHADELPRSKQLTVDLDAASVGVTYASRIGQSRVLIGGGGGLGFSPILSTTVVTGTHYDEPNVLQVFEVRGNLQVFARFELASWLRVDMGARAGVFIHLIEDPNGGEFAALFVAPALGWRWLWIGPRVSAGVLTEPDGPTAEMLSELTTSCCGSRSAGEARPRPLCRRRALRFLTSGRPLAAPWPRPASPSRHRPCSVR